jgi:MFS superfamily sulfate permease-like transporter
MFNPQLTDEQLVYFMVSLAISALIMLAITLFSPKDFKQDLKDGLPLVPLIIVSVGFTNMVSGIFLGAFLVIQLIRMRQMSEDIKKLNEDIGSVAYSSLAFFKYLKDKIGDK